jgi:hypothetical protein
VVLFDDDDYVSYSAQRSRRVSVRGGEGRQDKEREDEQPPQFGVQIPHASLDAKTSRFSVGFDKIMAAKLVCGSDSKLTAKTVERARIDGAL